MFTITTFSGNHRNVTSGEVHSFDTFQQLADCFKKPKKGEKFNGYFVRGELDPPDRKDANLKSSNLLIIDADTSSMGGNCPPPKELHEALKAMGLEHFIYTSHSHSAEQNKYRAVIPCELTEKAVLKPTVTKLMNQLQAMDVDIANVKEMSTWSQPWFVPTRDDPEDGLFEYYYGEGKWYTPAEGASTETDSPSEEPSTDGDSSSIKSVEAMIKEIQSGKEYHNNLNNLIWQEVKDGKPKETIKQIMLGILNGCEKKDERWQTRVDELDHSIAGAMEKNKDVIVNLDNIDVDTPEETGPQIPWPPGLLGELADVSFKQQIYQYKEVAVVSAIGLIAGIAGRKFNAMGSKPMGLNVYMTLIMSTGMGKEGIGDFIEKHILNNNSLSGGSSFYGNGDFTSAKAITNQFESARSQVCVVSEAGLLLQTKAGNIASKTAMLLDMYSKSHGDGWTKGTTFSGSEDSIPRLRAVAATLISEATPETLLEAYRETGAIDTGHLPRQSIFRVTGRRPKMNRRAFCQTPEKINNKIGHLIKVCSQVQNVDDPTPWMIVIADELEDDFWEFADWCDNIVQSALDEGDTVRSKMATRMFVKAVKYAAIATVFNYDENLTIQEAEWNWAKDMVRHEFDSMSIVFKGDKGFTDPIEEAVEAHLAPAIFRLLTKHKTKQNQTVFRKYDIRQSMRKNKAILDLNDNFKSGLDKCLEFMCREGYITKVNDETNAVKYRITEMYKVLMTDAYSK